MNKAEDGYRRYLELGGIINETDYQSAIDRMNPERSCEDSQRASTSYGMNRPRPLEGMGPQIRNPHISFKYEREEQ